MLFLARDTFERLMGPVESVLAERIREYEAANLAANGQSTADNGNLQVLSALSLEISRADVFWSCAHYCGCGAFEVPSLSRSLNRV